VLFLAVVLDLLPFREINGILTDIGRQIGDPFQVSPNQ